MALPTIVVAGVPNLAATLTAAGVFPRVLDAPAASSLRDLVTGPQLRALNTDQLVFICGDALVEDSDRMNLEEFLRKVTNAGYRVLIVAVTARASDLQRQNPRSKLLTLPLNLNAVLYAIGLFGYQVEPVSGGDAEIAVHAAFGAAPQVLSPVAPAPPAAPAWTAAPAPSATTPEPAAPAWQPVTPEPTPAPPVAAQPSAAPTPSAPVYTPSPTPFTPATQAPSYQSPAPAPHEPAAPVYQQPGAAQPPAPFAPAPANAGFGSNWTPPQQRPTLADFTGNPQHTAPQQDQPPQAWTTSSPQYPHPQGGFNPATRQGSAPDLARPQRRGYVITISTSKGGTGKSSLTLNLAAFLGMRLRSHGKTVCVIDANTQQADSGKYLDVYRPNINTIVNDPSLLSEDRILGALVHKPEYNLSVLLGPATPDEANPLAINARLYCEVLDLLKKHFDYILIDTAVAEKFHSMFSDFSLPKADYIIVPVAPNFPTLHNAHNWLQSAVVAPRHEGGAGIDRNRIGVVLNRAEEGIGCSEPEVRATMASWHFLGSIPETKEWKAANNRNELVAPKNYAELSQAFAEVLHAATREPILLENFSTFEPARPEGLMDKLRAKLGRR